MPPQSHQDRQMPLFLLICIPLIAGVICICIVICCWRHHTKSHIRMQSSPLTDTTNHNDPEEDLDAKILGPIPPGSLRRHIATVGNNKNLQSDATGNPATAASSDLQPSDITAPCPTVPPIAGSSGNSVGLGCRFNSASRSFEKISSGLYVSQALADAQSVPVASNLLEPNPHLAHHQLIPPLAPAHHHKCEHKDSGNISVDESAESRAVSPARLSMGGTWPRPVSGRTESSSTRNSSSNRLSAASSMEAAICQRCGGCSNASAVITAASATSGYASSEYFKSSNSSSNLSVNNIRNSYCNGLPPSPTSFSRNSNTNSSPSRNSSNNSYPLPPYNQQLNLSNSSIKSSSRTKFHNNNNNNQIIIPPIKTFVKSKRKSRSNSSVDSSGFCCVNAGVGRSSTNKTERDRAMGCNSCADFAADPEEELPYMHRTILSPCVIDDAQLIISDDGNYKTDGPEEAWQKRRNKKPQQCSSSPDARGKKHHHNCEDEGARTSSCEVGVHLNNFIHSRTRTYSQAEDGGEHADGHAYNDANSDVFGEQLRPATKYEIQCSTSLALTT